MLADIGGYTTFLSDVGIEHAKEITSHLFNRMVEVNPEHWKVGNVVGDCLFMYSDSGESPDEIFSYVRLVYENFCESIEEVAAGSTCRCGACDRSADLALKFVVHRGEFDTQQIAGRQELIGSEIVVAHRLLKDSVPVREYALFTAPLSDVAKSSGLVATSCHDEYEDIGSVDYVYVDLQPAREAFEKGREVYLTEETADVSDLRGQAVGPRHDVQSVLRAAPRRSDRRRYRDVRLLRDRAATDRGRLPRNEETLRSGSATAAWRS